MENRPITLKRTERLEADIDLRTTEVLMPILELQQVPAQIFKYSNVAAYSLGEKHAEKEFRTEDDLLLTHGYKRPEFLPLPIWHIVQSPDPNEQEIADFLASYFNKTRANGFQWPEMETSYEAALAHIRASYGTGYSIQYIVRSGLDASYNGLLYL